MKRSSALRRRIPVLIHMSDEEGHFETLVNRIAVIIRKSLFILDVATYWLIPLFIESPSSQHYGSYSMTCH